MFQYLFTSPADLIMTFNLESTDSDKFDHLALQLKLWSEEPDYQVLFLTSDQITSCSRKVFSLFSDIIRNVVNHCDSTSPIIISVPLDLKVMTSIYQLILNGSCGDADNREIIDAGKLFNININELKY